MEAEGEARETEETEEGGRVREWRKRAWSVEKSVEKSVENGLVEEMSPYRLYFEGFIDEKKRIHQAAPFHFS